MGGRISVWWRHLFDRARSLSIRTKTAAGTVLLLLCFGGVVILGVRARMTAVMSEEDQDQAISTAQNIEGSISSGLLKQSPSAARRSFVAGLEQIRILPMGSLLMLPVRSLQVRSKTVVPRKFSAPIPFQKANKSTWWYLTRKTGQSGT